MSNTVNDETEEALHALDFYGAPAWTFWLLCIATGVICGMVIGLT